MMTNKYVAIKKLNSGKYNLTAIKDNFFTNFIELDEAQKDNLLNTFRKQGYEEVKDARP